MDPISGKHQIGAVLAGLGWVIVFRVSAGGARRFRLEPRQYLRQVAVSDE
jgi:hypothetical protein